MRQRAHTRGSPCLPLKCKSPAAVGAQDSQAKAVPQPAALPVLWLRGQRGPRFPLYQTPSLPECCQQGGAPSTGLLAELHWLCCQAYGSRYRHRVPLSIDPSLAQGAPRHRARAPEH